MLLPSVVARWLAAGWVHVRWRCPRADRGEVLAFRLWQYNVAVFAANLVRLIVDAIRVRVAGTRALVLDITTLVARAVLWLPPAGTVLGTVGRRCPKAANVAAALRVVVPLALTRRVGVAG